MSILLHLRAWRTVLHADPGGDIARTSEIPVLFGNLLRRGIAHTPPRRACQEEEISSWNGQKCDSVQAPKSSSSLPCCDRTGTSAESLHGGDQHGNRYSCQKLFR